MATLYAVSIVLNHDWTHFEQMSSKRFPSTVNSRTSRCRLSNLSMASGVSTLAPSLLLSRTMSSLMLSGKFLDFHSLITMMTKVIGNVSNMWKKEQASRCCTADVCLCQSVNQLYNNKKWPNLFFFPLLSESSQFCDLESDLLTHKYSIKAPEMTKLRRLDWGYVKRRKMTRPALRKQCREALAHSTIMQIHDNSRNLK